MYYYVLTLFPEMIEPVMHTSMTGRAMEKGLLHLDTIQIRDFAGNRHNRVDDYPYGGGAGMVMQAGPVYRAFLEAEKRIAQKEGDGESSNAYKAIYLTPQGQVFSQEMAEAFSREENLIFLCGHYEGIDERVIEKINPMPVSIGDYILTGGELPALVLMDAVSRLIPGVLHNGESAVTESFCSGLLEYPQYTRPDVWEERKVPPVLLSGHHKMIEAWRREEAFKRTAKWRPDLLTRYGGEGECKN